MEPLDPDLDLDSEPEDLAEMRRKFELPNINEVSLEDMAEGLEKRVHGVIRSNKNKRRAEHTKQLTVEMRGGGENPKYSETMTADERDLVAKIGDIEDDEYALKMKKMKWLAVFNCIMSSLVFISQK